MGRYTAGSGDIDLSNVDAKTLEGLAAVDYVKTANFDINNVDADTLEGLAKVGYVETANFDINNVDADTLDAVNSTQFLRSDTNDSFTGTLLTVNNGLTVNALTVTGAATIAGGLTSGDVVICSTSTVKAGFFECNGAAISRTTYATLFAAIGTLWGVGNGSTTFNLPDFRGEFLRGLDNGRGVDVGRVIGVFQDHQLEDHKHDMYAFGLAGGIYNSFEHKPNSVGSINPVINTNSANVGAETRPRNHAVMYCIKF